MTTTESLSQDAEGAGVFSSYADLAKAAESQDAGGVAAAATAAGLDTLGVAMDPLGSLAAAGVGWAIEHLPFLREPLDAMLGDPDEIGDRARAWHLLSRELDAQADAFAELVTRDVGGWQGEAADAYRAAAGRLHEALASTGADAAGVGETVLASGAMVGTVRSLIRDAIAEWVGKLILWLVASVVSAGLAAAAAVPSMVLEATTLALHAADTISKVVARLEEASAALAKLVANMGGTADELASIGSRLPAGSTDVAASRGARDAVAAAGAAVPTTLPQGLVDAARNVRGSLEGAAERTVAPSLRAAEMPGSAASVGAVTRPGWKGAGEGVDELRQDPRLKAAVESGKQAGQERGEQAEWREDATPPAP